MKNNVKNIIFNRKKVKGSAMITETLRRNEK